MLIPLILCERGVLREPSLYLSLFFKANRSAYYEKLQEVRESGDWEGWLAFFLDGVAVTAANAVDTARRMNEVYQRDREKLLSAGKATSGVMRTHECMFGRISANAARVAQVTELSPRRSTPLSMRLRTSKSCERPRASNAASATFTARCTPR